MRGTFPLLDKSYNLKDWSLMDLALEETGCGEGLTVKLANQHMPVAVELPT